MMLTKQHGSPVKGTSRLGTGADFNSLEIHQRESVLLFELGERTFAVRQWEVQEVVQLPALIQPVDAPSTVAGYLNLRSVSIPVLRIGALLGFHVSVSLQTPIIVLRPDPGPVAWLVGRAVGLIDIHAQKIGSLSPKDSFNGVAEGVIQLDEGPAVLLRGSRLLHEHEKWALEDLGRRSTVRLQQWEQFH